MSLLLTLALALGSGFHSPQRPAPLKEIVATLVAAEQLTQRTVDERGGPRKVVDVKSVDLNRDGTPEYFVYCTCEVMESNYVIRQTAKGLEIIYEGTQREVITPLKTSTKGWRDIRSTMYRSVDGAHFSITLRWTGSEYR